MSKYNADKSSLFGYMWRTFGNNDVLPPTPEFQFAVDLEYTDTLGRKRRRAWAFDWAFVGAKLAIEVDGNAWQVKGGGSHMQKKDLEKLNEATRRGWRVLRFTPQMLEREPEKCVALVLEVLAQKGE